MAAQSFPVSSPFCRARADHFALGIGEHHHHIQHHLGHPIVLTDRADRLIHEVDIHSFLAEVLNETREVGERPSQPVEFVCDHHVVLRDGLAEALVFSPRSRRTALAEVAVPLDLIILLIILLADCTHLSLFVLVVGRDADVGGDLHGVFGHPIRTGIQYIKNGDFRIDAKNYCFSYYLQIVTKHQSTHSQLNIDEREQYVTVESENWDIPNEPIFSIRSSLRVQ
jgi:hypothetical protein